MLRGWRGATIWLMLEPRCFSASALRRSGDSDNHQLHSQLAPALLCILVALGQPFVALGLCFSEKTRTSCSVLTKQFSIDSLGFATWLYTKFTLQQTF